MILLHYKRQFRNTQRKPGSCLSGLPAHRTFLGWRVSDSAPDTVWPLSSFTDRPLARNLVQPLSTADCSEVGHTFFRATEVFMEIHRLSPPEVTMALRYATATTGRSQQPAMVGGTRWASILDAIGNTP